MRILNLESLDLLLTAISKNNVQKVWHRIRPNQMQFLYELLQMLSSLRKHSKIFPQGLQKMLGVIHLYHPSSWQLSDLQGFLSGYWNHYSYGEFQAVISAYWSFGLGIRDKELEGRVGKQNRASLSRKN